jgi:hypothetical protein
MFTMRRNIVIFWKQNDSGLYGRRVDMIAKYLAARDDIDKVIIIDHPISYHDLQLKKAGEFLTHNSNIYQKTQDKIAGLLDNKKQKVRVFVYANDTAATRELYLQYLDNIFILEHINPKQTIFWFYPKNDHFSAIVDFFKPEKIVADVVDDHRAWPGISSQEHQQLTEHYKTVLAAADCAFVNCNSVLDSMSLFTNNIHLVPNGCEPCRTIHEPLEHALYQEIKKFPGKIFGFVGNLEAKIDIKLLGEVANAFPSALIVLIGSTHSNPSVKDLAKQHNIRLGGVVEYEYINAYVRLFDVGLVPHIKMPLTDNMNPLKVFVYISNKVPVVCTDINNVPQAPFVKICKSNAEFIDTLRTLSTSDTALWSPSFDLFIQQHGWPQKIDAMLAHLDTCTSARKFRSN